MVTRNDVAKLAGVSPAVVSYVINNSNYVSAEKKAAVLKAIKDLDYVPDSNARGLRQRKTNTIAVIRGSQLNDMFNDLLYNIESLANSREYTISLISVDTDNDYYAKDSFIDKLISRHFDAIFIANSSFKETQINRLSNSDAKILLYVTKSYLNINPTVGLIIPDYRAAVKKIISELINKGHRKILMVPNIRYPGELHTINNHRFAGYKEAFSEAGLKLDYQYLPESASDIPEILKQIDAIYDGNAGIDPPTAIYADETVICALIMKKLTSIGLRVPEDVSVVCSSSSTMATITTPALTAVGFNSKDVARQSLKMLLDMIDGKKAEMQHIAFSFYNRESISSASANLTKKIK